VGLGCAALAAGLVAWFSGAERTGTAGSTSQTPTKVTPSAPARPAGAEAIDTGLATFPDPNAPGTSARVFLEPGLSDSDIFRTAGEFTGQVHDDASIQERREAIRGRGRRGIAALRAKHDGLKLDATPTRDQALQAMWLRRSLAMLYMYEGRFAEADAWLERGLEVARTPGVPAMYRANLVALRGIAALRQGEVENCLECLGPSSCIFPIEREAVHRQQTGSRAAARHFTAYLDEWPGDLRVRWLLNLACMTLGEYPEKVPPRYLIPIDSFRSRSEAPRFGNVAPVIGLDARGPSQAGGSVFDDFDGDGWPDLFVSSFDPDDGASLFLNRRDGTFEDRSASAGLTEQVYALNLARADYDNDGNLDVLLLRGGWETPARMSLLRNKGGGLFEDVTVKSGLGEPIASEAAAWGDFDNDGLLDLYVCGEYLASNDDGGRSIPDPRNRCRLYRNRGDGTFVDVAAQAGVLNEQCAKGAAWGDIDGDGDQDLFVSNMRMPMSARLYRNNGDGTFTDVAAQLGITGSPAGFTCLFWDFDNDGRLDLFASDYKAGFGEVIASFLGLPVDPEYHPRLYRNLGPEGFRDVSRELGLGRPIPAMAVNCGDIDNDGYLDLYLGTGWMSYSGLVPNLMFRNVGGHRFEDVTDATGTGHLQKGHGVSFADYDGDGDLDLFMELGGGYPGDKGYSALFRNPGAGRHWLQVKLVGTRTNRSALGARIRADLKGPDGAPRSIYRTVGNNGSFGGNSLVETIGLLDAKSVDTLTITWPTSRTTQTFRDLAADQAIEITEGSDSFKPLRQPRRPDAPRN
jgi:hypothetical protein